MNEEKLPADGYVFKHSTRCPVSADAADHVKRLQWHYPVYWVNVVEQRALSNWVAEMTGVKHESPQLILFRDGKVKHVWNHTSIRSVEPEPLAEEAMK